MATAGPGAAAGVTGQELPPESLIQPQKESASLEAGKSDELPSAETLKTIYSYDVLDKNGKAVKFRSLVQGTTHRRNLIVFIRHFFCGFCQEYIRALAKDLPPSKLESLSIPTSLTIIGCGDPSMIADYVSKTSCPYAMYADPTRKIYDALGMVVSFASDKKPEYISISFFQSTLAGIKQGLKAGFGALKSGKWNQNGGELVWVDGKCRYIHRMKDTTSHLEIRDLEHVLEETS